MCDTSDKFIAATTDETIDPPNGPGWPDGDDWATESGYHSNLYSTQGVNDGLRVAAGKYGSGAELGDLNPVILANRHFPSGAIWKGGVSVSGFSNPVTAPRHATITCTGGLPQEIIDGEEGWLRRIPSGQWEQFYKIIEVTANGQNYDVTVACLVAPWPYHQYDAWAVCKGAPACAVSLGEGWLAGTGAEAAGITGVVGAASTAANLMKYGQYNTQTQQTDTITNYDGGAAIGVAGRAVKDGEASIWGVYAHSVRNSGTGTDEGNAYGLEVDMNNESGEDHGAQDQIEVGTAHDVCIRILNQATSENKQPITAGLSIAGTSDTPGMWNGILFDPYSVKTTNGGVGVNMVSASPYMGIKFGVCAYSHIVGTQGLWITNQHATTDTVFTNTAGADWLWRNTAGGGQVLKLTNDGSATLKKGLGMFDVTPPATVPTQANLAGGATLADAIGAINGILGILQQFGMRTAS